MTVSTRCPACQAVLSVSEDGLGQPIRCRRCNQAFTPTRRLSGAESLDTSSRAGASRRGEGEDARAVAETRRNAPEDIDSAPIPFLDESPRSRAPQPQPAPSLGRIGRFELQAVLGQGAFGRVYRAHDPLLDRPVALKVPRLGPDQADQGRRFLEEAKAAARLKHPNIVAVFESGQAGSDYYIASEFVEGQPLSVRLAEKRPSYERAALWVRDLAMALSYAHEEGIVHRDIKPANIMIGRADRAQLMDFGLAKRLSVSEGTTADGSIVGTPAYMAPEQARGDLSAVGPHSDQYSLGVVLYELLTGRRPYEGPVPVVLAQVRSDRLPPAPREINPRIPADLEAICLKAMRKNPARRYPDAGNLAVDLQRWLKNEPVAARPPSKLGRFVRWCRREPWAAGMGALAGAAVAAVLVVLALSAVQQNALRDKAEKEAANTRDALNKLVVETQQKEAANQAREEADKARAAETLAKEEALARALFQSRTAVYVRDLAEVRREALAGRGEQAQGVLRSCAVDLQGWEWDLLMKDPRTTEPSSLKQTTHPVVTAAFHPDGRRLAYADGKEIKILDLRTGDEVQPFPPQGWPVQCLCFSPDGKRLASGSSREVKLWDMQTGREALPLKWSGDTVSAVAFSPDGQRLACTSSRGVTIQTWSPSKKAYESQYGGAIFVWDTQTGKEVQHLIGHVGAVTRLAYSPDGRLLASADGRLVSSATLSQVRLWDTQTGNLRFELPGHTMGDTPLVFSPDGTLLASVQEKVVKVWDTATGKPAFALSGHRQPVQGLAWSPDGRRLLSTGADGAAKVWDAYTGQEALTLSLPGGTRWAGFSPDGSRLVTGGGSPKGSGELWVWDAQREPGVRTLKGHTERVHRVAFSPNGAVVASGSADSTVRLWEPRTGRVVRILRAGTQPVSSLAFSPDGKLLATSGGDRSARRKRVPCEVRVWEVATGKQLLTLAGHTDTVFALAFSPDSRQLVSTGAGWQEKVVKEVREVQPEKEPAPMSGLGIPRPDDLLDYRRPGSLVPSPFARPPGVWPDNGPPLRPDPLGRTPRPAFEVNVPKFEEVLTTKMEVWGEWKVWDLTDGKLARAVQAKKGGTIISVAFPRDGERLATGSADGTIRLWDVASGEEKLALKGNKYAIASLCFSPGGKRLAAAGSSVRLWEVGAESGRLLFERGEGCHSISFDEEGKWLAGNGSDKAVVVWDAATGEEVHRLKGHEEAVTQVAFGRDGQLASASYDQTVKVWDPPAQKPK